MHKSKKPPDEDHPFGYGKELYFWALIVALVIFAVGGGVSAYEGVLHMLHPAPLGNPFWNYAVLATAVVFESVVMVVALKQFLKIKGDQHWWTAIRMSKDPRHFTVLFEDTAALLGLVVALIGVFLAHQLNNPYFDGAASIVIGTILMAVAALLAYETKGLLIGEGADRDTREDIRRIVQSDPSVESVQRILTMHFGPDTVLAAMDLRFRKNLSARELEESIARIESKLRARHEKTKHIFIESDSLSRLPEENRSKRPKGSRGIEGSFQDGLDNNNPPLRDFSRACSAALRTRLAPGAVSSLQIFSTGDRVRHRQAHVQNKRIDFFLEFPARLSVAALF